jgi:hypothetical protein
MQTPSTHCSAGGPGEQSEFAEHSVPSPEELPPSSPQPGSTASVSPMAANTAARLFHTLHRFDITSP